MSQDKVVIALLIWVNAPLKHNQQCFIRYHGEATMPHQGMPAARSYPAYSYKQRKSGLGFYCQKKPVFETVGKN